MALVKTATIDVGSVGRIDVTFEQALFASSLKVRKTVTGLGSLNLAAPDGDAANVKLIQAAQPTLTDHDEDSTVPEGSLQCECKTKPTGDLRFTVAVLRK